MSDLILRDVTPGDVPECGRILFAAFQDIANRHSFPPDFESLEQATGLIGFIQSHGFGVVAERDGRLLGSNFLAEADPVAALGPISVDPEIQESGIGRQLMEAAIERGRGAHGVRLVQDAFNSTSMALYASLGFEVRDPLVLLEGAPSNARKPGKVGKPANGIHVRRLGPGDLEGCAAVCHKVHGITRSEELRSGLRGLRGYAALRDGRITAYASTLDIWFAAHGVAETDADMQALILGAAALQRDPLHFLFPTRQADLFRFLLGEGMRIVKPMTLMTRGPYQEPTGAYFPSVGY